MRSTLLLLRKCMFLFSTLVCWGITVQTQAQCGGSNFPAPADIIANAPEASGYSLVYRLPVPSANQGWTVPGDIPYATNNAVALGSSPFTRIAYYMKLESVSLGVQWVWVSMDKFSDDLSKIGMPTGDILWQQQVQNMNVINHSGTNVNGITGNIEIWSNGYDVANSASVPNASDVTCDFGDTATVPNGYGSFQIHDFNAPGTTLMAYNGFTYSGFTSDDLGIGNNTYNSNPDWTFISNAHLYDVKEIYVFVNATGGGTTQPTCNNATLQLDASGSAILTPSMVTNAVIGNCGVTDITLSQTDFTCANTGANTVTVTFTVNGNTSSCTATVNVADNISPVITATGTTETLTCGPDGAEIEAALGSATATDNCGTPTVTSVTSGVTISGGVNSQSRTFTATDGSGNTSSVTRTVTWEQDATPPVITATGTTLTLPCNAGVFEIDAALGTATATDNCGTPSLTSSTGNVFINAGNYTQIRTWNSTDGSGNAASVSRTVTWPVDTESPVITASGTATSLACNPTAAQIEAALGTATATDNCSTPDLSVSTSAVTVSGSLNSQTRTWIATDAAGNTATTFRTVTWPYDNIAPVINATGTGTTLGCNPTAAQIEAALGSATASDNCGTPQLSITTSAITVAGGNNTQTRTWVATDASGNTSTVSRTATWPNDNIAPVINATGTGTTLGCNPTAAQIEAALGSATATDNCGTPSLIVTTSAVTVSGGNNVQSRSWTATDASGNVSATSRTVTWPYDNITPVITTNPATATTALTACNPTAAAINTALGTATATDNCGTPTLTVSTSAITVAGSNNSQTRTWVATDASGNTSSKSRTVTWPRDLTAPVITTNPSASTTALTACNPTAAAINTAFGTATATDNCGTPVLTESTSAITVVGSNNSQTRTWVATDANGNTSSKSRTVTWPRDLTAPVITTNPSTSTTALTACNPTAAAINTAFGTATATDNCGTPTLTVSTSAVTVVGSNNSQTRTWVATDANGNTSSKSRTVTWPRDLTAPVITATGTSLTLPCNPGITAIEGALGTATATDNCGTPSLTYTTGAVTVSGGNNSQTRTWTATDAGGNTSTATRTVTWTAACVPSNSNHIFAHNISCEEFNDGATPLAYVCYSVKNRQVKKVSPNYFYYYVNVNAPNTLGLLGTFYVDVLQTKSCSGFKLYDVKAEEIYDTRCKKYQLAYATDVATGQLRITIIGAVPGREYTIAVKYDPKSLEGSTYSGNNPPVCSNTFSTKTGIGLAFGSGTLVPGSITTLEARPNCTVPGNGNNDDDDDDRFIGLNNKTAGPVTALTVITAPNPSPTNFTLTVRSNETTPASIRITDVYGKVIYQQQKVAMNNTVKVGDNWLPGIYFAEVVQGKDRTVIRLIKN